MDVFLNGFPKKLLVAISIVLIVTMCLSPCEARAAKNRMRHGHGRKQNATPLKPTKEQPRRPRNTDVYTLLTRKIIKKIQNTKKFFKAARDRISESKETRNGNPKWLPKVNFVQIHNHNYSDADEKTVAMERFAFTVPKLYKSLITYKTIWERLKKVTVKNVDVLFEKYMHHRNQLVDNTLAELKKLIGEVQDNMDRHKLPKPHARTAQMNVEYLQLDIDTNHCITQDNIIFRSYSNLLKYWYWEFRCPKGKDLKICKEKETLYSRRSRRTQGKLRQRRRREFRFLK